MKRILFSLIALASLLTACTDQNEVDIAYKAQITVSAAHLFDSYNETMEGDFSMKGTEGDWTLHIRSFVYDSQGTLVYKEEGSFDSLAEPLVYVNNLLPGEYRIVSIADFSGSLGEEYYKFWNISGEDHIENLNIQESMTICSSIFETLGISSNSVTIEDGSENVNIEIEPVTGLLEIIVWNRSLLESNDNKYSSYAPDTELVEIWAPTLKQVVTFEGFNPTYGYGPQNVNYSIYRCSPQKQYEISGPTEVLGYRALLPIDGRDFYWSLTFSEGTGAQYGFPDYMESAMTDNKINIEAGGQYVMDLILDGMYLFVEEHEPSIDLFGRLAKHIVFLNNRAFQSIMDRRFDLMIGASKDFMSAILGEPSLDLGQYVIYEGYHPNISMIACDFADLKSVSAISLTFTGGDFSDMMIEYLEELFTVFEKGTTSVQKAYINAPTLEEATVGITWNLEDMVLTYVAI